MSLCVGIGAAKAEVKERGTLRIRLFIGALPCMPAFPSMCVMEFAAAFTITVDSAGAAVGELQLRFSCLNAFADGEPLVTLPQQVRCPLRAAP
jgi:hypothetical protein